jgi:hypothetical protein
MAPGPSHEAALTSTKIVRIFFLQDDAGVLSILTLTARIHSAFSLVLNALHSFRTAGFVQERGS